MPILDITKTYRDGEVLFESDLDNIKNDLETFLNTTKIDSLNIQDVGITASTKLVDNSITSGKIASEAITTAKIIDSAISTAKIADLAVTTAKIADSNVTTAKINGSAVTTAKINDGAVTYAKRSLNTSISSGCGNYSIPSSGSYVSIPNLSVTFTVTGTRPIRIYLYPETASSSVSNSTITAIYIDGTIYANLASMDGNALGDVSEYSPVITTLSAGSHTIDVRCHASSLPSSINEFKLYVIEI